MCVYIYIYMRVCVCRSCKHSLFLATACPSKHSAVLGMVKGCHPPQIVVVDPKVSQR